MALSTQFRLYHASRVITYSEKLYLNRCKFSTECFRLVKKGLNIEDIYKLYKLAVYRWNKVGKL